MRFSKFWPCAFVTCCLPPSRHQRNSSAHYTGNTSLVAFVNTLYTTVLVADRRRVNTIWKATTWLPCDREGSGESLSRIMSFTTQLT